MKLSLSKFYRKLTLTLIDIVTDEISPIYPPCDVKQGDVVAVAWERVFTICKVMEAVSKGERKTVLVEELQKSGSVYRKKREER